MKFILFFAILFSTVKTDLAGATTQTILSQLSPTTVTFEFLRGHKAGKGYSLQWKVNTSSGIIRFDVQSTYEDPNDTYSQWLTIGAVHNTSQNLYKFTDRSVMPGIINYRVIAVTANGNIASQIFTTRIP